MEDRRRIRKTLSMRFARQAKMKSNQDAKFDDSDNTSSLKRKREEENESTAQRQSNDGDGIELQNEIEESTIHPCKQMRKSNPDAKFDDSDNNSSLKRKRGEENESTAQRQSKDGDGIELQNEIEESTIHRCKQMRKSNPATLGDIPVVDRSPAQDVILQSLPQDDPSVVQEAGGSASCQPDIQGSLQISQTDDEDSEVDEQPINKDVVLADCIREWARENDMAHLHVDALLRKVNPYFPGVPLSHKTLLNKNSPPMFQVRKFDPHNESDQSEFVFFGLIRTLEIIVEPSVHSNQVIELKFNADGMKVKKSSATEFWVLQGKIHTDETKVCYDPFLISVWCGEGKPSSPDLFVHEFVVELNILLVEGLTCKGVHLKVKIKCFICDRPARAFFKCIVGHAGYFSCERCHIAGCKPRNTVIFPFSACPPRTMLGFILQLDIFHHKGTSPLLSIKPPPDHDPLDLIKWFILDFMHLGPLTNMKNMLTSWTTETGLKIPQQDIDKISKRMKNIAKQIPDEFQRSTRSLETLSSWKATEYRFFLLYCGYFVAKGVLPPPLYQHFLLFSVPSRILSSDELIERFLSLAEIYLTRCAQLYPVLYGEDSQSLYAHSLMHIADDVKEMKCNISLLTAFPFENRLKKVKACLRSGYKPLQQLCSQVQNELENYKGPKIYKDETFLSKKQSVDSKVLVDEVMFRNCKLNCKPPNNIIMMKNGDVVRIVELYLESKGAKEVQFRGEKLVIVGDAFEYPMHSSCLGIYEIKDEVVKLISHPLQEMKTKMVLISIYEESPESKIDYVVPFLHQ